MDKTPVSRKHSRIKSLEINENETEVEPFSPTNSLGCSQDLINSISYSPNHESQCVGWDPLKYQRKSSNNSTKTKKRLLSYTPKSNKTEISEKSPVYNIPRRKLIKESEPGNFTKLEKDLKALNDKLQLESSPETSHSSFQARLYNNELEEEINYLPSACIETSPESASNSQQEKPNKLVSSIPQALIETSSDSLSNNSLAFFNDDADELLLHCSQMIDNQIEMGNAKNSPLKKISKVILPKAKNLMKLKEKSSSLTNISASTSSSNQQEFGNDSFDEALHQVFDLNEDEITSGVVIATSSTPNINEKKSSIETKFSSSASSSSSRLPLPKYKREIIKTNAAKLKPPPINQSNNTTNKNATEKLEVKCTPEEIEEKRKRAQKLREQSKNKNALQMKRNLTM